MMNLAEDGVEWMVTSDGQDWLVAWYPPLQPPPGTGHGSAAVCLADGQLVLITSDGSRWGFPGGRPEPGEDWIDTLRREVDEEACATVTTAKLIGYSRGRCIRGHEEGLVLVRAWWRAQVRLEQWEPRFETTHRRLVTWPEVWAAIWIEDGFAPMYRRILAEATVPTSPAG